MNELAQIYSDSAPPTMADKMRSKYSNLGDVYDMHTSQSQLKMDEVSELVAELKKKYPNLSDQALYLMASGLLGQKSNVSNQARMQRRSTNFQKNQTY